MKNFATHSKTSTYILVVFVITLLAATTARSQCYLALTPTDASCPSGADGQITVQLTGIGTPYDVEIRLDKYTPPTYTTISTQYNYSGTSYTFTNLTSGLYSVFVTDNTTSSNCIGLSTIGIYDDSQWPVHPWSDGRATGIDVKSDSYNNVYATGDFNEKILFNNMFDSPGNSNIYLVKLDECGNILWDAQIGQPSEGACFVKALCLDGDENVIICGQLLGKINFPGGYSLSSLANNQTDAFIAKFSRSDGSCIWASLISGPGYNDNVRDVTADVYGNVYVIGDFDDSPLDFYHSDQSGGGMFSNSLTPLNGSHDNFIAILNSDGQFIYNNNTSLSTIGPDESGGIICAPKLYSAGGPATDIYLTGMINGNEFLGQFWRFDINTTTISKIRTYQLSPNYNRIGKSVAIYDAPNSYRWISFAGKDLSYTGNYFPFVTSDTSMTMSALPLIQTLVNKINLISTIPDFDNIATDIAINPTNGDVFISGNANEGTFSIPVNGSCGNVTTITKTPSYNNNWEDFFHAKFIRDMGCNSNLNQNGFIYSNSPGTHGTELINGICTTPNGHSCITGSFMELMSVANLSYFNPYSLVVYANYGYQDCFISRIFDVGGSFMELKRGTNKPEFNNSGILEPVKIFCTPNPVRDQVVVTCNCPAESCGTLELISLTGQVIESVYTGNFGSREIVLNLNRFGSGIYILRARSTDFVCNLKLIKE